MAHPDCYKTQTGSTPIRALGLMAVNPRKPKKPKGGGTFLDPIKELHCRAKSGTSHMEGGRVSAPKTLRVGSDSVFLAVARKEPSAAT